MDWKIACSYPCREKMKIIFRQAMEMSIEGLLFLIVSSNGFCDRLFTSAFLCCITE